MITATIIVTLAAIGQVAYHAEDTTRGVADSTGSLYSYCMSGQTGEPKLRSLDAYQADASAKAVQLIFRIGDEYVDVMWGELVPDYGIYFGSPRGGDGHTLLADWLYVDGNAQWIVPWDEVFRDPEQIDYNDCRYGMRVPPLGSPSTIRQVGDTTLDGLFDSSDLIAVFSAGQYEDGLPLNSRWADGDWNADGEFDSGDLVAALQTGQYEQPAAASQVPEPVRVSGLLLAAAMMFIRFTNRARKS